MLSLPSRSMIIKQQINGNIAQQQTNKKKHLKHKLAFKFARSEY